MPQALKFDGIPDAQKTGGAAFGTRSDGTPKGDGFLGALPRPDGSVSSEISIGVNIDGKEVDIPTLVPTLSQSERQWLLTNDLSDPKKIPGSIIDKAIAFARPRLAAGKSPFAGAGESPASGLNFEGIDAAPIQTQAPTPKWHEPGGDVMLDLARGAFKQTGRFVQGLSKITAMIPGMPGVDLATDTDRVYGLPPGASAAALEPANPTERVGGYVAEGLETLASLGATTGLSYARNARGQFIRAPHASTVGGRIVDAGKTASTAISDTTLAAMNAARADIVKGGPLTASRVGELAYKYGKTATKYTLIGMGAGGALRFLEKLTK